MIGGFYALYLVLVKHGYHMEASDPLTSNISFDTVGGVTSIE